MQSTNILEILWRRPENHQMVRLGVSPRGTIALAKPAKAYAYWREERFASRMIVESVFPECDGAPTVFERQGAGGQNGFDPGD